MNNWISFLHNKHFIITFKLSIAAHYFPLEKQCENLDKSLPMNFGLCDKVTSKTTHLSKSGLLNSDLCHRQLCQAVSIKLCTVNNL